MRMINKTFIAGMLAMALVFGMAGCDNGTSNGGSNTPTYPYTPTQPGNPVTVDKEADLYKALENGNAVTVYVLAEIPLSKPLDLKKDQHIVVAKSAPDGTNVVQSAGGPLFTITAAGNVALNIGAKLTLLEGSSLTVAGGAAVNVQTPTIVSALTDLLHVKSGAKLLVGVTATGAVETGAKLNVAGYANVRVDGPTTIGDETIEGAILAVAAEAGAVTLASANSGIEFREDAKLAIVSGEGETTDLAPIGSTSSVIVVPDNAAVSIDINKVYEDVAGETEDTTLTGTLTTAKESLKTSAVIIDTATEVQKAFTDDGATKVTYTGTTDASLGAISAAGKTLIITGELSAQDAAISVGTLEITGSVTTATENITQAILASLVKATGTGTVVLKSAVTVSSSLEVNLSLEIGDGVTFTLSDDGTVTGTGTIVNNGTIKSTQDMTINGAELGESLLLSGGTFEVTAAVISVASGTTLTIPADTELKLSGTATLTVAEGATLTVEEEATLTNEGTITFGAGSTLTGTLTNTGTIKTADETILASLLDSANGVTAGTVEASESLEIASATVKSGVTLKIASGKRLTVTGTLTIQSSASVTGAAGAKIELGAAATHSGTVNFYYSDGETAHSSSIPADTYTWVSTIGGSGGWKATDETDPPLAAEQETADAGDVAGLLAADGVTQVTYTGSDPLTGITVPANKTLNITGAIVGQTDAITVDTDGTATSSNTITTSNSINAAGLTSLVKLGGNGTIKLAAEVTGVETTLELSQNLEIGNSGSIAFADTFTSAAFNGSGSLTLSGSGAISLGSGVTSLGKTVTFAAGAEGTVTTGNAPALAAIVNAATSGNKITATGSLTPASDITVAEGVTLTIANGGGALIVDSGRTLTVNGTITTTGTLTNSNIIVIGENGSISDYTKVTNSGTIKTAYATVLTTLLSNVTAGTVEVTGTDASLAGGTVQGTATLKVSGTLTVNGAITATGTITNEGIIVLGSSGSITDYGQVTNNGTIKTSQVAKLTELLTSGVTAGTVEVTGSGITIGEDTTITVPGNVTLAIGNATDTATLTLGSYTTSKLVLSPTAKLAVLNGASEFAGVATVGVAGTNNKATFESEGGLPPIWTVTDDESGTDSTTVTLGTLVLTVSSGVVTTTAQGGSTAASLEAGEGTTITFAGAGA